MGTRRILGVSYQENLQEKSQGDHCKIDGNPKKKLREKITLGAPGLILKKIERHPGIEVCFQREPLRNFPGKIPVG